jgi:hypothetical protein
LSPLRFSFYFPYSCKQPLGFEPTLSRDLQSAWNMAQSAWGAAHAVLGFTLGAYALTIFNFVALKAQS